MKLSLQFDAETATRQIAARVRRRRVELLRCAHFCLATAFLIHLVPSAYTVRQTYEIAQAGGAPPDPETVARSLETKARETQGGATPLKGLTCRTEEGGSRFGCAAPAGNYFARGRLKRFFRETVPATVGWTDRTALEKRIERAKGRLAEVTAQSETDGKRLGELEVTAAPDDRKMEDAAHARAAVESELENRKQQMQILDEALVSRNMGERRAIFEKKRGEVSKLAEDLERQFEAADRAFNEAAAPRREREMLGARLAQLRAESDLLSIQIYTWEASARHSDAAKIPDPDAYRLIASGEVRSETIRDFRHLRWSIPLGVLLFILFEFLRLQRFRARYFLTPEEVAQETGLKFLGYWKG